MQSTPATARARAGLPRRLAALLPGVTRKALERFGFAYADLLGQWPTIVGPELAAHAVPERIRWPRRVDDSDRERPGRRTGGVLVVRVDGPMAVEIQHRAPLIAERINAFYGYFAVAGVKVVQGPLPARQTPERPRPGRVDETDAAKLAEDVREIGDDGLRAALLRLGRGVLGR